MLRSAYFGEAYFPNNVHPAGAPCNKSWGAAMFLLEVREEVVPPFPVGGESILGVDFVEGCGDRYAS